MRASIAGRGHTELYGRPIALLLLYTIEAIDVLSAAPRLPIGPSERFGVTARTVVLAPGSKTAEMAAKRWPYFPELAAQLDDVAVVGTSDDLPPRPFPEHCRNFVDRLSLRETAELMASAGVVIGNDCGLSHVAAATETPTLMIFGPTDHRVLGALRENVRILRQGLGCEPCWLRGRLAECGGAVDCLAGIGVNRVLDAVRSITHSLDPISPTERTLRKLARNQPRPHPRASAVRD